MPNVYLTGARAAGKTTSARELAARLNFEFVDTDIYLGDLHQVTVAEVVEKFGWDEFRKMESRVLEEVSQGPPKVIATGGGMILSEANRLLMRDKGLVFYLSAPAEVLAARLAADPKTAQRPSLTGKSAVEEVAQVLADREALYQAAAHQVIDASAPFDEVIEAILSHLR